ncbi:MAG: hypothetical protein JXB32_02750 [Deltaproteobacteria bacterium]|nr:hypothetical protein [Deltaproteobacteria bacterium]
MGRCREPPRIGRLVFVGLVLALVSCSKQRSEVEDSIAPSSGRTAAPAAAVAGPQVIELPFRDESSSRDLVARVEVTIPPGWKHVPDRWKREDRVFFVSPRYDESDFLWAQASLLELSVDGLTGRYDRTLASWVDEYAGEFQEALGDGARTFKNEEVREGVHAFAIGSSTHRARRCVGAAHLLPRPSSFLVRCQATLLESEESLWQQALDVCTSVRVTVRDPLVPDERARQEEAALAAGCPSESSVRYLPAAAVTDAPRFDAVRSVDARAWAFGHVDVRLVNVPLETTESRRQPTVPSGGGFVEIQLTGGEDGVEVLGGRYEVEAGNPPRARIKLGVQGARTWRIQPTGSPHVEVIARTPQRICGRFEVEDADGSKLAVEFVADILRNSLL